MDVFFANPGIFTQAIGSNREISGDLGFVPASEIDNRPGIFMTDFVAEFIGNEDLLVLWGVRQKQFRFLSAVSFGGADTEGL